jgi:hypothetical protein
MGKRLLNIGHRGKVVWTKQSNAYTTMRRLISLIVVFVKRLYVLTGTHLCHQLYATVSSISYTREDLYTAIH